MFLFIILVFLVRVSIIVKRRSLKCTHNQFFQTPRFSTTIHPTISYVHIQTNTFSLFLLLLLLFFFGTFKNYFCQLFHVSRYTQSQTLKLIIKSRKRQFKNFVKITIKFFFALNRVLFFQFIQSINEYLRQIFIYFILFIYLFIFLS